MNSSVILSVLLLPTSHLLLLNLVRSDVEREDALDELPTDTMKVTRVQDLALGQSLEQV